MYYGTNEGPILSRAYEKANFGITAYQFEAQASGYYYVRIHTNMSSAQNYYLLVGGPSYSVAECTVRLGRVTMSGSNCNVLFDLNEETRIPEDAIVYSMKVNNVGTTDVKGKKVIVYKYKRKTGYHKKNGHRQQYTAVKIEKINA